MSFERKTWLRAVIESQTLTREEKTRLICVCPHLRDVRDMEQARAVLARLVGRRLADVSCGLIADR